MPRCIHPDEALVGVLGLDKPPPTRRGKNRGLDEFIRTVRLTTEKYVPAAVIIGRKIQYTHDRMSREGIGLDVLSRGIFYESPSDKVVHAAIYGATRHIKEDALRQCSHSWGLKATRHAFSHSLHYSPYSIVHILAVHRGMELLIGRHETHRQAQDAVKKALIATLPLQKNNKQYWCDGDIESRGKRRIYTALMELHALLKVPQYQRVLFHPEIRGWGQFSPAGEVIFYASLLVLSAIIYWAGWYTIAVALSSLMALILNEIRLWVRDAFSAEQKTGGFKSWMLSTRYTGPITFVQADNLI